MSVPSLEYRAVVYDKPAMRGDEGIYEVGKVRQTRLEAEQDLASMCDGADPPYDDGWIEWRTIGVWGKANRG